MASEPESDTHYYYGTRTGHDGLFHGIVYHYDDTGNYEIRDHRTGSTDTEAAALDLATEWAEENLENAMPGRPVKIEME